MIHVILFFSGIVFLVGASRRWWWLVDPPANWIQFHPLAQARRRFGKKATLYLAYLIGVVFVAFGGYDTWQIYIAPLLR